MCVCVYIYIYVCIYVCVCVCVCAREKQRETEKERERDSAFKWYQQNKHMSDMFSHTWKIYSAIKLQKRLEFVFLISLEQAFMLGANNTVTASNETLDISRIKSNSSSKVTDWMDPGSYGGGEDILSYYPLGIICHNKSIVSRRNYLLHSDIWRASFAERFPNIVQFVRSYIRVPQL